MPVDSTHPLFDEKIAQWDRIRDVISGEDAVKAKGTTYLPILSGQAWSQYLAYKMRAVFYPATPRTLGGLSGAVFRKDPTVEFTPEIEEFTKNIDARGTPLVPFAKKIADEVIALGRAGVLLDMDATGDVMFARMYVAENIVNWREVVSNGISKVTMVVLKEVSFEQTEDIFTSGEVIRYRVLGLIPDGFDEGGVVYTQVLFEEQTGSTGKREWVIIESVVPMRKGAPLDEIPFIFFGPLTNSPMPAAPPLLPLADMNLSHYRSAADIEHGAHFTALPTVVISGRIPGTDDDEASEIKIGPEGSILLEENGKAYMLEYTGQGLSAVEKRLERKESHMAILGARMLEDQKNTPEAAAALRQRHRGENSLLAGISDSISRGIEQLLDRAAWWMGSGELTETQKFVLNKDFLPSPMNGAEVFSMVQGWMSGGFGLKVLYDILEKGERLPESMTFEEYMADIKETGPPEMFMGDLDARTKELIPAEIT